MKKLRIKTSLLVSAASIAGLAMGAGIALAAHPPIQLYTYEEVGAQYGMPAGQGAPVMVNPQGMNPMQGMPYSPKQTCSGGGIQSGQCHSDNTAATNSATGKKLTGYTTLADHAFHAALGYNEWMDNDPSGLFISDGTGGIVPKGTQTGLNPQKPWLQSHGHNGKW